MSWRGTKPRNKAQRVDYAEQIRGILISLGAFTADYYEQKMTARYGKTDLAKLKIADLDDLVAAWETKAAACGLSWDDHVIAMLVDPTLTAAERDALRGLHDDPALQASMAGARGA